MSDKISRQLAKNEAVLQTMFAKNFDVVLRRAEDRAARGFLVLLIDGLTDQDLVYKTILEPLMQGEVAVDRAGKCDLEALRSRVLTGVELAAVQDFKTAAERALSGDAVLFTDGAAEAIAVQTRKWMNRGVQKAETQKAVRGPKESFTETLLFNIALLRRKLRSPALKTELFCLGSISRTDVCLVYLEGIAEEALLARVRERLKKIDVKYILESGHIEQLIEDHHHSLFSTTGNYEKPDIVAAKLLKGRCAIFVDGTPFVLTLPMLMSENFSSPEDYYARPYYANFLRILRFFSYLVTLLLPALYVALVTFHREMIPAELLSTLIAAAEGVPLPLGAEMLIILILYELLREAILRLPEAVGGTIGIVGVFIIGEAAVGIHLIGAPSVVIGALTFITSAVVTPLTDSTALLRMGLLLLGTFFGAYGVFAGLFALVVYLASISSYGCPFLLPLSPLKLSGLRDSILRTDLRAILKRTGY